MSANEVLKQLKPDIEIKDDFLCRFLSNLFILFDNRLPSAIEKNVQELLILLEEKGPAHHRHTEGGQARLEYLKAA